MGVYVDDMLRPARVGRIQSRWSHLVADTSDELHAFAARLGMRPEWVQYPGHHREHYDLTEPKRAKAIELGAVQITYPHGIAEVIARKRTGMGDLARNSLSDEPLRNSRSSLFSPHSPTDSGNASSP